MLDVQDSCCSSRVVHELEGLHPAPGILHAYLSSTSHSRPSMGAISLYTCKKTPSPFVGYSAYRTLYKSDAVILKLSVSTVSPLPRKEFE